MCFTARLRPFCARCQLLPPALRSLASLRMPLLNGLSGKQKVGGVHTGRSELSLSGVEVALVSFHWTLNP